MTASPPVPRERPLLFSGPMVRAILDGRKTQTRRVMKPQPIEDPKWHGGWVWHAAKASTALASINLGGAYAEVCPYGRPGDLLWVRETWAKEGEIGDAAEYRADNPDPSAGPWRPSIFMPKRYARLWLRVTDVRVERLHDITERDAVDEGMDWTAFKAGEARGKDPRDSFRILWNELNADRGFPWKSNCWVWRIEFERTEAPA